MNSKNETTIEIQKAVQYSLYVLNGSISFVGSLLIITIVLKNQILRNNHNYLLSALADTHMVSAFQCMTEVYNSLFILGQQSSALMTLCVCMDRLIAMKYFNDYRTFGVKYPVFVVSLVYGHCGLVLAIGWILSAFAMDPKPIYSSICLTPYALPAIFYAYHGFIQIAPGIGSTVLYLWAFSKAGTALRGTQDSKLTSVQQAEKRRQARITKSLAVVMLYTFITTTVPFGIIFGFTLLGRTGTYEFSAMAPYLWAITCFGGAFNIIIYSKKYQNFGTCLKKLLRWHQSQVHPASSGRN